MQTGKLDYILYTEGAVVADVLFANGAVVGVDAAPFFKALREAYPNDGWKGAEIRYEVNAFGVMERFIIPGPENTGSGASRFKKMPQGPYPVRKRKLFDR